MSVTPAADALVGAAIIGQSGGPTTVINQSLVGYVLEAKKYPGVITRVLGARHGIKGILEGNIVDLGQEDEATLEAVASVPAAALGSVRKKPTAEDVAAIVAKLKPFNVRYFFYIGGNDSAETAHIINEESKKQGYEMRCFHIPKTIDNDLRVTDHCPGYGSACRFVAHGFQGDDRDLKAMGGCKINICMGRDAGWLTAASVLGQRPGSDEGPHLVYVPERAFDIEEFVKDVEACLARIGRCLVAVSEGVHNAEGVSILEAAAGKVGDKDAHGNVQLGGTGALGDALSDIIKSRLGCRVRADTYGFLQRSFPADTSAVDAAEARACGVKAVQAAVSGEAGSGCAAIRRTTDAPYASESFITPLSTVAKVTKELPDEFISGTNGIADAFRDYAMPLVGPLDFMTDLALVKADP